MAAVKRARTKKAAKKPVKRATAKKPAASGKMAIKMKCSACGASWLVGKVNVSTKGKHACIKCGKKTAKQA